MKKASFRPLLTATAAACLLASGALHAQTTLQSPGGQPGQSAAQPAGTSMVEPVGQYMGQSMLIPVSPAQSFSQPFSPVSSTPLENEAQGLRLRARAGIERDDNVLRVSGPKTSDTITSLGVGLRYNQRFSQQRVVLDAELNRFDYDNLGLDYNTLNYAGAWYWRLGNRFEGVASADRRQFRDVTTNLGGSVNRRTERNELFEGGYRLGAAWRVLAGVQHTQASSTNPANSWDGDPDINSVRLGAAYETGRGSNVTVRWRHGDGDYKASTLASGFKEDEVDANLVWPVGARTTVNARLGHLKRDHDTTPGRNFSGVVGGVSANWQATGKTGVLVGYARDLGSYLGGTSGHLESDRIYVAPVWRATELIAVTARYQHERRRWQDVVGSGDVGRNDKFDVLALGVDWQPRRSVGVGLQWRNERRDSSLPGANFRANVLGLSVRLTI